MSPSLPMTFAAVLTLSTCAYSAPDPRPLSPDDIASAKALVARMSLDQKISQVHGIDANHLFRETPGIPELGIPDFNFTNGPAGFGPAGAGHNGNATAMSSPLSLAATWDRNASRLYGATIGKESLDGGNLMLEAPDINITRQPQGGRTFESYGEDPYLVGQLAVANIQGIQSQGEIANVKHFAANNQETHRGNINEIIDERTLREIYLPAFEASIREGQSGSIMGAYPQINGTYCCENPFLLDIVLRKDWGFSGFVTCDFGATHSIIPSALAGLDYESEGDTYYGARLEAVVQAGQLSMSVVDQMLVRRFGQMYRFGLMQHPPVRIPLPITVDGAVAREIASEGIVLLKNDHNLLPLQKSALRTAALIGPLAVAANTGGGGSSHVTPANSVKPLAGLQAALGAGVTVTLDNGEDPIRAAGLAKQSDIAIVMVGNHDGEGQDHSLTLENNQDALVEAVAAANSRTIVVLKTGSAVLMPWLQDVPAVVEAWYPGEEDGNAVADVLTGAVNPSGRLPITFPASVADTTAADPANFPGINLVAHYAEGVLVGYRSFDSKNVAPLFPFGYGLSYTTFKFSSLKVQGAPSPNGNVKVSFNITNTGNRAGAAVAQVYVGIPGTPQIIEPPKQLKGFDRVELGPNKTARVTMTLNARSFAFWDSTSETWKVQPGTYPLLVGDSSRSIILTGAVKTAGFDVPASVCP